MHWRYKGIDYILSVPSLHMCCNWSEALKGWHLFTVSLSTCVYTMYIRIHFYAGPLAAIWLAVEPKAKLSRVCSRFEPRKASTSRPVWNSPPVNAVALTCLACVVHWRPRRSRELDRVFARPPEQISQSVYTWLWNVNLGRREKKVYLKSRSTVS